MDWNIHSTLHQLIYHSSCQMSVSYHVCLDPPSGTEKECPVPKCPTFTNNSLACFNKDQTRPESMWLSLCSTPVLSFINVVVNLKNGLYSVFCKFVKCEFTCLCYVTVSLGL